MAIDPNAFTTGQADATNVIPKLWADEIYRYARENSLVAPLTQLGVIREDNRLLGNVGLSFQVVKLAQLSASTLSEGTPTPISAVSTSAITVTVEEHGLAVQRTNLADIGSFESFKQGIISEFGDAMRDLMNTLLFNELATTTTAPIYANGKDSTSITSSDTFNKALVYEAQKVMKESNRTPKALIIHPAQEYALKTSFGTEYTPDYNDSIIRTGYIGVLSGVPVFVSNYVTSTTENSTTVYQGYLLGNEAVILAWKQKPVLKVDSTPVVDRAVTIHINDVYGFKKFWDESIIPLKSA